MFKRIAVLFTLALAVGCSSDRQPPPQPAPRPIPRPTPVPVPPPVPTPAPAGWEDLPLTPGTWTYENSNTTSSASYGTAGAPLFRIYCEGPTRSVFLQRYGQASGRVMAVRTSFGARSIAYVAEPGPQLGTATLPARDAFLDSMIFSRGRFSVEVAGTPMLVLPSWAEVARVVEDCRKQPLEI